MRWNMDYKIFELKDTSQNILLMILINKYMLNNFFYPELLR